jgi:sugar phosphate isomerase/epimerase
MRISVSNIAWDPGEDEAIALVLRRAGIDQLDLAPGKYFPDPFTASIADVDAVRRRWQAAGFSIAGMQALLFGTAGLNMFADADGAMMARLCRIAEIGARLGAPCMTFGSPRQRDRSGLDDDQTMTLATDFFMRLGDEAERRDIKVCIEPNPATYGCNFLTNTIDAAMLVRALNHPAILLQLDVGTMIMNEESPAELISTFALEIGHVHASEPGLEKLGNYIATHVDVGAALRAHRPDIVVTIEMVASNTESHILAVERAVEVALDAYGEQSN